VQGIGFRDRAREFAERNVEVLGISLDSVEENRAFADKFSFSFRLLSDPERSTALAYGAVDSAQDAHAKRYTFVISSEGKIEQAIQTLDPETQAEKLLAQL